MSVVIVSSKEFRKVASLGIKMVFKKLASFREEKYVPKSCRRKSLDRKVIKSIIEKHKKLRKIRKN
jgi:hypothetical protein